MEGYIQALINKHYRKLEGLEERQSLNQMYELEAINELEDLKEYYIKNKKVEVDK